jgi:hypothetical protein
MEKRERKKSEQKEGNGERGGSGGARRGKCETSGNYGARNPRF